MRFHPFSPRAYALALPMALGIAVLAAGCTSEDTGGQGPNQAQAYNQFQRLGNPLVSEVLLEKRNHPLHGAIGPDQDVALIAQPILAFLTGPGSVAGRSSSYANVLGSVLLPDMLIIQTDKAASSAGWLTWLPQLGGGWGGRKLDDDVVDLALLAVFGDPFGLDPAGAAGKQGLTTDNVGNDSQFRATFPYVGLPN